MIGRLKPGVIRQEDDRKCNYAVGAWKKVTSGFQTSEVPQTKEAKDKSLSMGGIGVTGYCLARATPPLALTEATASTCLPLPLRGRTGKALDKMGLRRKNVLPRSDEIFLIFLNFRAQFFEFSTRKVVR